ncbi:MAG: hypothetical protein SGILL_005759, partial [Bacillariaceae sp.]
LSGAQAILFANACWQFSTDLENNFDSTVFMGGDDEHPLWVGLSLQQRLHLVTEIAKGLLCNNEPLPPDTVQHYAAYLGIFSFLETLLEVETDMARDGMLPDDLEAWCNQDQGNQNQQEAATLTEEEQEVRENERLLIGRAAEKQQRKLERRANGETATFNPPAPSDADYMNQFATHLSQTRIIFEGRPCTAADRRPPRPLQEDEKHSFLWRIFCDDAFQEDTPDRRIMPYPPPLSTVNFGWKCPDKKKWVAALCILRDHLGAADLTPLEKKLLFGGITDVDYADKSQHARIKAIDRAILELRTPYDASWKPQDSGMDQRLLYALGCDDIYHGNHHGFTILFERKCILAELTVTGPELERRQERHGDLMREFRGRFVETREEEYNSKEWLQPGNFQERLDAFRSVHDGDNHELRDVMNIGLDVTFDQGSAWPHPKDFKSERTLTFRMHCCNPQHVFTLDQYDRELLQCSRCKVVQYCSRDCQLQHWPKHKK